MDDVVREFLVESAEALDQLDLDFIALEEDPSSADADPTRTDKAARDGLIGCELVVGHGSQVIAQDEETSVVWGMPGYVTREGVADATLPLDEIAPEIVRRTRAGVGAGGRS